MSGVSIAAGSGLGAGRPGNWSLFAANRLAAGGLALLAAIVALALVAPLLPLPSPDVTDPANRLLRPLSAGHLLGTDHLGRDILSRLLSGTRTSVAVGLSATMVAALIGSLIGLVAGYVGGRSDNLLMRGIDMIMAFPYILLALAIVAALGPGLLNALLAISVVNIPFFARNIRGVAIGLSHREFIDAARLSGKGHVSILLTEVLPNVLPVIVITMATTVGWMILETAGLSFLGLGAQPPQADLGSMLGEGRRQLINAPHTSVIPGLMIFVLVISINLMADGVRDVLDPRLKSGALGRPSARTEVAADPASEKSHAGVPEAVLKVSGLVTQFRIGNEIYRAVGGVDLELEEQECLGLVGESGSGKSVTAMSVLGLVPTPPGRIVAGSVTYKGEDMLNAPFERLRKLRGDVFACVFQDPLSTLHPLYTVGEQIIEAIRAQQAISYARAYSQAEDLLKLVQIPSAKKRMSSYPHEMSGGMRQRVCIAMALANNPEALIADEPTTALDVTVQAQMLKLLNRLRTDRQAAVLFITHDFGVVSEICDRVAVMYAGQVVEVGPTDAVLETPAHPYTRKLIDCVPVLGQPQRRLEAIGGMPPPVNRLPAGCAFAERCPQARPDCEKGDVELDKVGERRAVRCLFPLVSSTSQEANT